MKCNYDTRYNVHETAVLWTLSVCNVRVLPFYGHYSLQIEKCELMPERIQDRYEP